MNSKKRIARMNALAAREPARVRWAEFEPVRKTPAEIAEMQARYRDEDVGKAISAVIGLMVGGSIMAFATLKFGLGGLILGGAVAGVITFLLAVTPWPLLLAYGIVAGGLLVTYANQATQVPAQPAAYAPSASTPASGQE